MGSRWQDVGDTLTLHFKLSSRFLDEGDALFLAGHPSLLAAPQLGSFCGCGVHTLPSLLVHEGAASFLVGHLLSASVMSASVMTHSFLQVALGKRIFSC